MRKALEGGSFTCTLCGACSQNCPMKIELAEKIKEIRALQNDDGIQSLANKEMLEKIKKEGNPFGKNEENKIPDKLYCC